MEYILGIILIGIGAWLIRREWRKDWMPGTEGLDDEEDT